MPADAEPVEGAPLAHDRHSVLGHTPRDHEHRSAATSGSGSDPGAQMSPRRQTGDAGAGHGRPRSRLFALWANFNQTDCDRRGHTHATGRRWAGVSTGNLELVSPPAAGSPVVAPSSDQPDRPGRPETESDQAPTHRWKTLSLAGGAYLVLSIFLWSNVWSSHPTSTTICGCGDNAGAIWVMEWPAYAISHGLSPLFSTAMGYPSGINLLANASVLVFGVVLAPVTWLFGPIATLNVALTLSPALSALGMFVLLRRWVTWTPAAFMGGLFYGFSAFILVETTAAAINLGLAVVPPLFVACLDELLIRQRHRPVRAGVLLGLLVALQFFIGTEVLLIMSSMGAVGVTLVVIYAAHRCPDVLRDHARHALTGLSAGVATAVVLLAYPAWFALAGPAHLAGIVWPGNFYSSLRTQSTVLRDVVLPRPATTGIYPNAALHLGFSYQGPLLSSQYIGIGALVVLIGGFIVWRRDRRLWLFGALAMISLALSLGSNKDLFLPWELVTGLPLFKNIIPYRFILVTYLAVAVMLGLIVEHTYLAVNQRRKLARETSTGQPARGFWRRLPRWVGAATGVIVAAIALVPSAAYVAQTIPFATRPVVLPKWFRTVAPHLSGHQVLLTFTQPSIWENNPMAWQAVDRMRYSTVNEAGPAGLLERAGEERVGATVIANASSSFADESGTQMLISTDDIAAVRDALRKWGVTTAVIPDQPNLASYDQIPSVTLVAALMTAVTGERPIHQADAWVWTGVDRTHPASLPTGSRLQECTNGVAVRGVAAVDAVAVCVLAPTGTPG